MRLGRGAKNTGVWDSRERIPNRLFCSLVYALLRCLKYVILLRAVWNTQEAGFLVGDKPIFPIVWLIFCFA